MVFIIILTNLFTFSPEPLFSPAGVKGYGLKKGETFIQIDPVILFGSAFQGNYLSVSHSLTHSTNLSYQGLFNLWIRDDPSAKPFAPIFHRISIKQTFSPNKNFSPFVGGSFNRLVFFGLIDFYNLYGGFSIRKDSEGFTCCFNTLILPPPERVYPFLFVGSEKKIRKGDLFVEALIFKGEAIFGIGFGSYVKKRFYVNTGLTFSIPSVSWPIPVIRVGYHFMK